MKESIFAQVSPFVRFAVNHVTAKFDVAEQTALDVVQSVLVSLLSKPDERLNNPKRYLLRACRWKALRSIRRQQGSESVRAATGSPEILIALEHEDRELFFCPAATRRSETLKVVRDEQEPVELSATFEVPSSAVRLMFTVSKLNQKAS
jgi:DNA-directed RNA polymerase specialized sigma24 family protein